MHLLPHPDHPHHILTLSTQLAVLYTLQLRVRTMNSVCFFSDVALTDRELSAVAAGAVFGVGYDAYFGR